MPVPPNTTSGTAIVIPALPFLATIQQADWALLPASTPLWWQYTTQTGDIAVGLKVSASVNPATVGPYCDFLTSPTGSNVCEAGTDPSGNPLPAQAGLPASMTVYFRMKTAGTPGASGTVTLDLVPALAGAAPIGSLVIPDDAAGFPTQVINATTGQVVRTVSFPAGEHAGQLPGSGTILTEVENSSNQVTTLALYTPQLGFTANVAVPGGATVHQVIAGGAQSGTPLWIVGSQTSAPTSLTLYVLNADGTVRASWPLPVDTAGRYSLQDADVSSDGLSAYWLQAPGAGAAPSGVHRLALTTGTDSTLVASDAAYRPEELRTLADGSFVVALENVSTSQDILRHFSAAGAHLGTDYAIESGFVFDHFAPGPHNPADIVLWEQGPATGTVTVSRFRFLNVADWSASQPSFDLPIWEKGQAAVTTTARFGPSSSCPLFLTTVVLGTPSGPTVTTVTAPLCGDATALRTITITGMAFPPTPTVTLTDPHGATIPTTVTSATSTTVVVTAVVSVCGMWTVTVGGSAPFAFPTSGTSYLIRRLRRVALPWDEAHRQKTISRLELIGQAGIGDSVTTDPIVMLRLSRDGGKTWGVEQQLHAGAMGQYLQRLTIGRLGRARNPVVEITTTDPVAWSWVQLLVDLSEGTS